MSGSEEYAIFWYESVQKNISLNFKSLSSNKYDGSIVLLNHESFGYYRVMYNTEHWARIAKQIKQDKNSITILSRIAILCDIEEFYSHDMIDSDVYDIVKS